MVATNCRAASRGNCVSVSSVITYFTFARASIPPTMSEKQSPEPPRSSEFKSASLPRLRSKPIQICSSAFHLRGRWNRKKLSSPAWRYFAFSAVIRCSANRTSGSSSASVSRIASPKSVSSPKRRFSSRFARNRTSSASTRSSMAWALVSMVGMTTSVRDSGGMPFEKSIRGSGRGATSSVANQFVSDTESWLADSSDKMPINTSSQSDIRLPIVCFNRQPASSSVISVIKPKYGNNGNGRPDLRSVSSVDARAASFFSSRGNPLSIR